MKNLSVSLGGENTTRIGGEASVRVRSTHLSSKQKSSLWNRLRKLDRKIGKQFPYITAKWNIKARGYVYSGKEAEKFRILDQKRKEIRNRLKGYPII